MAVGDPNLFDPTCDPSYIASETQRLSTICTKVALVSFVCSFVCISGEDKAMADTTMQRIYSKDIYHGLPDLSHAPHGLTAVVTGANGISGAHMVSTLLNSIYDTFSAS